MTGDTVTKSNNVIFSTFLYFKYSFLSISFIYKFVHAIIFLFIEEKLSVAYLQSCQKSTSTGVIKSSAVAYKRVAYKTNLVQTIHYTLMANKCKPSKKKKIKIKTCSFIKKKIPVNFAKFLRKAFLQNTSRRLFLYLIFGQLAKAIAFMIATNKCSLQSFLDKIA